MDFVKSIENSKIVLKTIINTICVNNVELNVLYVNQSTTSLISSHIVEFVNELICIRDKASSSVSMSLEIAESLFLHISDLPSTISDSNYC